jgi:hypothetical protein
MTDHLDRRLRDALRDAPLPPAPIALHATLDRFELEPVPSRRPSVRRPALVLAPLIVGVVAIVALALAGGWDRGEVATSPSASASQPAPTAAATGSPLATDAATGDLVATDRGLTLTVSFDRTEVAPGGDLTIDVIIRNDRSVPVDIYRDHCSAPATMYALVPVPDDPAGREWAGIAGVFKTFALTEGNGPGGAPATAPGRVYATGSPCREPGLSDLTLEPGGSTSASLTWTAELVPDLPALPGAVPFDISVGHDPAGAPPSYPPDYSGPIGSWVRSYEQLTVHGVIDVAGEAPRIVTAGEALDALLADREFATWLAEQPKRTWSGANILLQNYGPAQGIVPAGPHWEIDLFREMGVPRNWAIAFVEPFSGELLNVTYCNVPCDR